MRAYDANERELVERAKHDPVAFGKIFDAHYDRIYAYALKRTASADVAADIAAETFVKALKGLRFFSWRGIPIAAWLYRIAHNELNMYFRRGRYTPLSLSELMDAGFDPAAEEIVSERSLVAMQNAEDISMQLVREALQRLPAKYQQVIGLRFFEGKSSVEIAQILGIREGTARSLLSRGLTKLREQCEKMQHFSETRIREYEGRGEPRTIDSYEQSP